MHSTDFKNVQGTRGKEIRAETSVPGDSLWFSGHFPEEPLLPGIAQLAMVHDLIRRFYPENMILAGVKRVRFKQVIRPENRIEIQANPDQDKQDEFQFRLKVEDEVACTGKLVYRQPDTIGR